MIYAYAYVITNRHALTFVKVPDFGGVSQLHRIKRSNLRHLNGYLLILPTVTELKNLKLYCQR